MTKVTEKGLDFSGVGYKNITDNGDGTFDFTLNHSVRAGVELTAAVQSIGSGDGKGYKSGFHIFLNKLDAKNYGGGNRVVKVKFRKGHTLGYNNAGDRDGKCIIAKHMTIVGKA